MIDFTTWENLRAGHTAKPKVRIDLFYYSPNDGNGDLIYNTCREIIDRNDSDNWAYDAIENIFKVLSEGKRWPDYMAPYVTPTDQFRMTQDPWVMAYCCAAHLGRYDLIEKYKPTIKIFNLPDKWAWRRALLHKPNTWWIWRRIIPFNCMQDFVYVFYGYMDLTYLKHKDK